jgi:hypothetical protein
MEENKVTKKDLTKPKVSTVSTANNDSKLNKREEIASRILAGITSCGFTIAYEIETGYAGNKPIDHHVLSISEATDIPIKATDSLIRKLRKTKQEEE